MANVNVSLVDYRFTATLINQSLTVNTSGTTVNVINTSRSITIGNTTTQVEIVDNGIMTMLAASTATINEFVGDGITKTFQLSQEILGTDYATVVVGGVEQNPGPTDSFTIRTVNTGSESAQSFVDFIEAPPNLIGIQVRFFSIRTAFDIVGPPGPAIDLRIGTVANSTTTMAVSTTVTGGIQYLNFILKQGATGPQGPSGVGDWNTLQNKTGTYGPTTISLGQNANGGSGSVSIGAAAGYLAQSTYAVAIGNSAGSSYQASEAVAVGHLAGNYNQRGVSVAIGSQAGQNSQGTWTVAIGRFAGNTNQSQDAIAIGHRAGTDTQGIYAVALGAYAGEINQDQYGIAIGNTAGQVNQGSGGFALGVGAGNSNQGNDAVAIGSIAGAVNQGIEAVAIGHFAQNTSTQSYNVAIGRYAGNINQGSRSTAIGSRAGQTNQGNFSVAIGGAAGQTNQHANTIVINALGSTSTGGSTATNTLQANSFYVTPVRHVVNGSLPSGFYNMAYNPTTGEIIYWT